jgi:hypothetical protein
VLDAASALHDFFEAMLSFPDADPSRLAVELIAEYQLDVMEGRHLRRVAERAEKAKRIVGALEERFGVRVEDDGLKGRMILDTEGFTNYIFGRGGKSTRRVFSHNIALGVERVRWRGKGQQDVLGFVARMPETRSNPLGWDVVQKVRENERVHLKPLVYKARGSNLLNQEARLSEEEKLLRWIFGRAEVVERAEERLLCEIMRHEIRHIIDHILNADRSMVGRTVEVQSYMYENDRNVMVGFKRDLKDLKALEDRLIRHDGQDAPDDLRRGYWKAQDTRRSLEQAASLVEAIKCGHPDRFAHQEFSYVFSLVDIENLPVVLSSIKDELAG